MTAATGFDATAALRAAVGLRLGVLAFSLPYSWAWSAGLPPATRLGVVAAHGLGLLAAAAWTTASDDDRGLFPHLGLVRDAAWIDADVARRSSWPLAGAAVAASLLLAATSAAAPVVAVVLLGAAWGWSRLPDERRYLGIPEMAGPLLVFIVPVAALHQFTPATPPIVASLAGACFLGAFLIACHIRDRNGDLSARVPTVATRNLPLAQGWMLTLAFAGAVAASIELTIPLAPAEVVRLLGALGFGIAATVRQRRVPALALGHALFVIALLAR